MFFAFSFVLCSLNFLFIVCFRSTELRPLSFRDQIKAISDFENRVHIARAVLTYIVGNFVLSFSMFSWH